MKIKILPEFHLNKTDDDMNLEFKEYYTGTNKTEGFIINNTLYMAAFFIPMCLLIFLMLTFGFAPFGDNSMFVVDGAINNVPVLTQLITQIHNSTFQLFSLHGSVGSEMYSTLAFYTASPFTIVCMFFDQATAVGLLSIFTVFRIAMSAPIFLYYLTHRPMGRKGSKYDASLLIFALGYALSSYALVQYNDFMFMDIFMLFPLFMLGFERVLCKLSPKLYIVILSVCLFSNFYLGTILVLFSVLIFFFLSEQDVKSSLLQFFNLLLYNLFCLCISAITVIPGFVGLFNRFISGQHFPDPYYMASKWIYFLEHFFYNTPSYANIEINGSNLYIGTLMLILVCFHFLDQTLSVKRRIADFSLLLLSMMILIFSGATHIMQLLIHRESSFNCIAFIYLFILLNWSFESIYHIRDNKVWKIIVSIILPVAFALLAMNYASPLPNFDSVNFTLDLLILFAIILILYRLGSIKRNITYILLVSITVLELLANAYQNTFLLSQEETPLSALLSNEAEEDLLYAGSINDGRSMYMNDDIPLDVNANYLFSSHSTNPLLKEGTTAQNPFADSFSGLRYVLCNKDNSNVIPNENQYSLIKSTDTYDVYENQYVFPTAFTVPDFKNNIDYSMPANYYNSLAFALGADSDLFTDSGIIPEVSTSKQDTVRIDALGSNVFGFSKHYDEKIASLEMPYYYRLNYGFVANRDGELYIANPDITYFKNVKKDEEFTHSVYDELNLEFDKIFSWNAYYLNRDVLQKLSEKTSRNACTINKAGLNGFSITTNNNSQASTLLTIIPYNQHYQISIDNTSTQDFYDFEGHLAISLPAGQHEVTIKYPIYPLYVGLTISIFAILFVLYIAFTKKKHFNLFHNTDSKVLNACITFAQENYVYILSFFIPLILFFAASIYINIQPFGLNTLFEDDGVQIELPSMMGYLREIQKGNTMHSWVSGGGYYVGQPSYILNLIPLLIYKLLPIKWYPVYATFLQMFRTALLGPSIIYYLTHRLKGKKAYKKDPRLLIPAFCYSLGSYMIALFCYSGWFVGFILIPFVLLGMDYLMETGKKRYYVITLAILITKSYYIGMFTCFYLVLRFFTYSFKNFKDFVVKGIRFAFCSMSMLLICFSTIFGTLSSISASTYGEEEISFPAFQFFNEWWYYIRQLMPRATTYTVSWNEGNANLYFGILPICLLFLCILSKHMSIKEKLKTLIPFVFFFFALNEAVTNYILNGLHYQNGVPNRFAFLLPLIAALACYDMLLLIRKESLFRIFLSVVIPAGLFILTSVVSEKNQILINSLVVSIVFLLIYLIVLILMKTSRKNHRFLQYLLIFIFGFEMISNAFTELTDAVVSGEIISYIDPAVEYLREYKHIDDTLERISVNAPMTSAYAKAEGIKSTHTFAAASITNYQQHFANLVGNSVGSNVQMTKYSNSLIGDSLASNRYIIKSNLNQTELCGDLKDYKLIAIPDRNYIWENEYCFPFAYYIPHELVTELPEAVTTSDFWAIMSYYMIGDNSMISIFPVYHVDDDSPDKMSNNTYEIYQDDTDTTMFHYKIEVPETGYVYSMVSDLQYLGEYQKGDKIDINVNVNDYRFDVNKETLTLGVINKEDFIRLYNQVSQHPLIIDSFTDNTIDGHINMPVDGSVNFSMPYDPNWKAYVDGKPMESSPMADAFYTIPVPQGEHTIHLSYEVKVSHKNEIITILSWIVFGILCFLSSKYPREQDKQMDALINADANTETETDINVAMDSENCSDTEAAK